MNNSHDNENRFVGYEYKTVTVPRDMELVWEDGLQGFGWKLIKSEPAAKKPAWRPLRILTAPLSIFSGGQFEEIVPLHPLETEIELKFKRDRNIPEKAQLNRLQLQFESQLKEISYLENSSHTTATAAAFTTGLVGTVFLGAATFSYLANQIPLTILLAIPGFIGWSASYFIHKMVKSGQTSKVAPLIEHKYDGIFDICVKANALLRTEAIAIS